jgi:type IV pilus assembly protein PilQ
MRVVINARFRDTWNLAMCAAVAVGIIACAGATTSPSGEFASDGSIRDVQVESSPGAALVTLVGPVEPVFTAFQQTDPDRLIVDLAGVSPGMISEPVAVYDGVVEEILVAPFETGSGEIITRVEISLSGAVDYDVHHASTGVEIALEGLSREADADENAESSDEDPWMSADAGEQLGSDLGDFDELESLEEPVAPPIELQPATLIRSVTARQVGDGVLVHIEGDGSVESAVTFTLEDPARLVVDLPDLQSEIKTNQIEVGAPRLDRVRVGVHADKIRFVIDAGSADAPFDGRRVLPVPTGLVLALGTGSVLDEEVASLMAVGGTPAREPMDEAPSSELAEAEPADESADETEAPEADWLASADSEPETTPEPVEPVTTEVVTIYGVEFDSQEDRDRIVVLGESAVDYLVYEPDADTVVLSIAGAVIDPEAAVRIAPEPAGAVSLVTAFDQPDMKTAEVRVVVKRAPNLKPEISRRGSLLIMDFPRTGALAAVPPVMEGESSTTLAAEGTDTPEQPMVAVATTEGLMLADPESEVLPAAIPGAGFDAPPAPAGLANPAAIDPPASISILHEGGLMDGKEYVGRRISLDFKDVQIADVLRLIAEVSDLNVIAGDEVNGAVTIRLVDVPWDQALDVILLTKGLGFMRIGNVLRIAPTDVLAQEEELRLQERRAKEKLEDLVVKLQPVNYADVSEISSMVTQLLTARGSVNVDERTNTLIIKDIASIIDEATALIKAVDTMTPQVMIEAKIVEANLDFSRELGSTWTFGTNPLTESTLGSRNFIPFPGETDGVGDGFGNSVIFGNPITSGSTGLLNMAAHVIDNKFNVELQLQAAEANGEGKVISSPRIVTLDNSEAKIEQGVSIPFQTFENGDAQLEFVDAVLSLRVTPHITSDSSIIMEIEVSRNAPDDSVFTLTGSPAIAKNQVTTETLVKDGQTLVLGGIYVVDKAERESRTPFLHKIPFIGNAFKSNEYRDSRQELLIFVTPRVVQTANAAS